MHLFEHTPLRNDVFHILQQLPFTGRIFNRKKASKRWKRRRHVIQRDQVSRQWLDAPLNPFLRSVPLVPASAVVRS